MAETIDELLEQRLREGVQSVSADGVSVSAIDVEKQIALAEYLARKSASSHSDFGLRRRSIKFKTCG